MNKYVGLYEHLYSPRAEVTTIQYNMISLKNEE